MVDEVTNMTVNDGFTKGLVDQFCVRLKSYFRETANNEVVAKFYQSIESSGKIRVSSPDNIPTKRGVSVQRNVPSHEVLLHLSPISNVYRFEAHHDPEYTMKASERKLKQLLINQSPLLHQYESLIVSAFMSSHPQSPFPHDEFFILLIRVFLNCLISDPYRYQVQNLTTHKGEIKAQMINNHLFDMCNDLTSTIVSILPERFQPFLIHCLVENLFDLACTCAVNFNVLNNRLHEPIGISFDPLFSLINHSCIPNTMLLACDNDQSLQLITTRGMAQHTELKTNYCFTTFPTEIRKLDLKRRFFFDCKCKLCLKSIDCFFSYTCPKCECFIHHMTMTNCFDAVEVQLFPIICQKCQFTIDTETFQECELWHKLLLAMILTCDDDEVEIETADQLKEIMIPLLETLRDKPLSTHELTALYLEKAYSYTINPKRAVMFKEIIDKLMAYNIIPGFCFPLNLFINNFDETHFITDFQDKEVSYRSLHLKFELQRKFFVSLPSDISGSMTKCNSLFIDLGHAIMNVLVSLYHEGKPNNLPEVLSDWLTGIDLFNTLIRCATFFYLQAIDTYLLYSARTVRELIEALKQIKIINDLSSRPLRWCPASFNDEIFLFSLQQLFQFGKVDHKLYFHKNGHQIRINLANGEKFQLFKSVTKLESRSLEQIQ